MEILCENSSYDRVTVTPCVKITYEGEDVTEVMGTPITLPVSGTATANIAIPAMAVERWDVDSPRLYRAEVTLLADGEVIDADAVNYGYRTIEVRREEGFILNGRPIKLRGVCNHQDHAGVGVAVPDSIQDYRVRLLKDMGANAYRTSHSPVTPALLDACDRLGMLVLNETGVIALG